MTFLSKKNPHEYDECIIRDENHIYIIRGINRYPSVSSVIHRIFPKFNTEKVIRNILSNPRIDDPCYDYYKMNRQGILKSWDESKRLGTLLHSEIENYYNLSESSNVEVKKEFSFFLNFVNDFNLIPFRTEWMVFSDQMKLAGTIDMIFKKKNGNYILIDWKNCKNISMDSYKEKCIPFNHLENNNYTHYSIQLNLYKEILKRQYDIIIDQIYIVCLHKNQDNYLLYEILDLSKEVEILFPC